MSVDELKVTLAMLDYDYLFFTDTIDVFLKSKDMDPFLRGILNDNGFNWIKVNLYGDNCAIHINITSIKEKYFEGGTL